MPSSSPRRACRSRACEVPASVDRLYADEIREGRPQVNLSESLGRVPGIVVQNRQNYAQDLQISSRGFGARATFGVRGIRLIADGIPATMPDGQGQAATFALGSAERIEVLRGPFSALYGNAAGGVIVVETADPPAVPTVDRRCASPASYGTWRARHAARRDVGRAQRAARRLALRDRRLPRAQRGAARSLQPQVQVRVRAGHVAHAGRQPAAPAGDAGSARPDARAGRGEPAPGDAAGDHLQYAQDHLPGAARRHARAPLERRLEDRGHGLRRHALGRAVPRDSAQRAGRRPPRAAWCSSTAAMAAARCASPPVGDRAALARRRIRPHGRAPAGLHQQHRHRRRPEARRGRRGLEHRPLRAGSGASPSAGARTAACAPAASSSSPPTTSSCPGNPDDSGTRDYSATTPVAGLLYQASKNVSLLRQLGRGFETPTFAELAHQNPPATGLNFALEASRSRHAEIGVKALFAGVARVNAALFGIETKDEIVVDADERRAHHVQERRAHRAQRLRARRRHRACRARSARSSPTPTSTRPSRTGSRAAVLARSRDRSRRKPAARGAEEPGLRAAALPAAAASTPIAKALYRSRVPVNDANSEFADAYTVFNLVGGLVQQGKRLAHQRIRTPG